jgi:hypothetical protein
MADTSDLYPAQLGGTAESGGESFSINTAIISIGSKAI